MATYDENSLLEALAELSSFEWYFKFSESGLVIAEAVLSAVDVQAYLDSGLVVAEAVLYGSDVQTYAPQPVPLPPPPVGPPDPVYAAPHFLSIWSPSVTLIDAGPRGGTAPTPVYILDFDVETQLSDPGGATLTLIGDWSRLMGAILAIEVTMSESAGSYSGPVFTGWVPIDGDTNVENHPEATRLAMIDSLGYLDERRLAISMTFKGGTAGFIEQARRDTVASVSATITAAAQTAAADAAEIVDLTAAEAKIEKSIKAAATKAADAALRNAIVVANRGAIGLLYSMDLASAQALPPELAAIWQAAYDKAEADARAAAACELAAASQAVADAVRGEAEQEATCVNSGSVTLPASWDPGGPGGGTSTPPASGQTRRQCIQQVLETVQFPFNAIFPNDGGKLAWNVQVSDETPLDVIRLIAESAGWHFYPLANGDIKFVEAYATVAETTITPDEYDLENGVETRYSQTPINRIQVRGTPGPKQVSATVNWIGSQGLIGKYQESTYENPFIGSVAECVRAGNLILNAAQRAGRVEVAGPALPKMLGADMGGQIVVVDIDADTRTGSLESRRMAFSRDGRADMNLGVHIRV